MDAGNVAYAHNRVRVSLQKEGSPAIGDNMDGPGEYWVNWNKLDTERQILEDLTYMWIRNSQTPRSRE